jgi:hypothetical protein
MGLSYVVVAKRLENQRARDGVGLGRSNAVAFTGVECSGGHPVEEFVRGVGPGKPPIDVAVEGRSVLAAVVNTTVWRRKSDSRQHGLAAG